MLPRAGRGIIVETSGGEQVREVSGLITAAFVRYVQRAKGSAAAIRVAASIDRSPDELKTAEWYGTAETLTLIAAAAEECGDIDIGRRAGEAAMWDLAETGGIDYLTQTGSPQGAIALLVDFGARISVGRVLSVLDAGDDVVIIDAHHDDLAHASAAICGFSAAIFGLVPSLFGHSGTTVETACQLRGAARCRFEVRWHVNARTATDPDVAASEVRVAAALEQFEQLRRMAAELAKVDDADLALTKIAEQAGATVVASRYLLRVTLDDGESPRLHHGGFAPRTDVEAIADRLFAADAVHDDEAIVVEIASARRAYGWLAAMVPPTKALVDSDRRRLQAYADHAAAALDAVVALETARRHRDTSTALLELGRALAEVRTSDQTIEQLVTAMRPVLGCGSARIYLQNDGGVAIASTIGDHPAVLEIDDAPRVVRDGMSPAITRVAIAPISVRGEVLGVAVAGFTAEENAVSVRDLLARLSGLADHAATALDNARLLEQLNHDALHDRLTGLPNRVLVEDRVETSIRRAERDGRWPSLLFIDLDRFKNVNDTLGHRAGDELIRQVGLRIRSAMRRGDTLGRLGGDEFVVLLEGTESPADAQLTAERLGVAMGAPFTIDGNEIFISCSIGISHGPTDGTTYEQLLQNADVAMYNAKDSGRATFSVYAPPRSGPRRDRLELETRLHRAVDNGELAALYQPQVDLQSLQIVGVEALVRWDHPELGRLTPDRFLPLAEESGMIVEIDRWVRSTAFAQVRRWRDAGLDWRLAINLSTRDLQKADIALILEAEVVLAGITTADVEVEVTDRVVLDDNALTNLVARLRGVGFSVAIDDFGTGTSVLGRLRSCSVDTLKIDRSFVSEIGSAGGDTIVRALVSLGRSLELSVVAEGIETVEQIELLTRLGCPLGQGFAFSRPVEAEMLTYAGNDALAIPMSSAKLPL